MAMKKVGNNRIAKILISFYLIIIFLISYAACFFAYEQQQVELLSSMDMTLVRVVNEYEKQTEDFWSLYVPIFGGKAEGYHALRTYFLREPGQELTPSEKVKVRNTLASMALRSGSVKWVAAFSSNQEINYIYQMDLSSLLSFGAEFPYYEELVAKTNMIEIYSEKTVSLQNDTCQTIAVAGGVPVPNGSGAMIVGFDTAELRQICTTNKAMGSLQFDIVLDGNSIFSSGEEPYILSKEFDDARDVTRGRIGSRYVCVSTQEPRGAKIYYSVDYYELFRMSHRNTPLVLGVVLILVFLSILLYILILRVVNREVGIIHTGLDQIGANHLDYRILGNFQQSGFREVADAINQMASTLKNNIDRAYYYELKQKESEMQELQSKFNPHFLYNSLEMFRARCYENGDDETAELIAQTASIFRGFISSRTFVPIQEELAFSKRYLTLFKARYGEAVEIRYDIDTEVLQYGIVRNVLQPLIENYFVHGIDTSRNDNFIRFTGKIRDEDTIQILVEDNGIGMSPEQIEQMNQTLHAPITTEQESYGLKNLHQRLRLFYGEDCGLNMGAREGGGMRIELVIGRMKCDPETGKPMNRE